MRPPYARMVLPVVVILGPGEFSTDDLVFYFGPSTAISVQAIRPGFFEGVAGTKAQTRVTIGGETWFSILESTEVQELIELACVAGSGNGG